MGAGEIRAGKAFVEVYTKDSTAGGLAGIRNKLGSFAVQIAKIGGVAVTAASAAITGSVMKAINTGASIDDLAKRYQLGTDAIQQLSYAAQQSGTNLETLIIGIRNMQKGLGGGTVGDELKAIGLSAEKLRGLSPEKQFEMITEALALVADPAQKTALAMKLFGKSGADLIPLFGTLQNATKEFDALGITMSEGAVKEAAALDDQLEKLKAQFSGLVVVFGSKLIPAINDLIEKINGIVPKAKRAIDSPDGLPDRIRQQQAAARAQRPIGAFMDSLAARLEAMKAKGNAIDMAEKVKAVIDDMQSMLYAAGIGRRQMRPENIAAIPGNIINGFADYLMGSATEKMKSDVTSFGTFDKRDIAGGAYLQASQQQLAELKKIERDLDEIKRKKPGVPWG
jgi:hypothetical protein